MAETREDQKKSRLARIMTDPRWDQMVCLLIALYTIAFLVTLFVYRAVGTDSVARNSISAYYYHTNEGFPMRSVFFFGLGAVGILLILYQGSSRGMYWMLNVAGVLLLFVSFFPMDWPPDDRKGLVDMTWHAWIHYVSAVLFFLLLGAVGIFKAKDTLHERRESSRKLVYTIMYNFTGWGMIAVPWLAIILNAKGAKSAVYVIEFVAVGGFWVYWLVKIAEQDVFTLEKVSAPELKPATDISSTIQKHMESVESITIRLDGAMAAQKRIRLVLIVMGVTCAALIIASYNAYLSFDREFTLREVASRPCDLEKREADGTGFVKIPAREFKKEKGSDILTEQAIKNWSDSQNISSSLLGIKVSIDDAPVLGSATLFVISIWFLLSVRLGYYTIFFLLKDTQQLDPTRPDPIQLRMQWRVYQGIISSTVFSRYWKRFLPVWDGLNATTGLEQQIKEIKEKSNEDDFSAKIQSMFLNSIVGFIYWLPVITMAFIIVLDLISYYQRSPFDKDLMPTNSTNYKSFKIMSISCFSIFTLLLIIIMTLSITYKNHTDKGVDTYYINLCNALTHFVPPAHPQPTAPLPPVAPLYPPGEVTAHRGND
jgi:hypothetical protein